MISIALYHKAIQDPQWQELVAHPEKVNTLHGTTISERVHHTPGKAKTYKMPERAANLPKLYFPEVG